MPSPIEILLDPISLIVLAMYGALMLWEFLFPARPLPRVKNWKIKGMVSFVIFFYLSSYMPMFTDPYLAKYTLFDLSHWGPIPGAIVGMLLYEVGLYIWHRSMHGSNFLWRTFHQMHHSAERMDTYGAFWFSPLDMAGFTFLGSICFALLIGLDPESITLILLTTTFFSIFQHANIKTPRWLGYIVQRPESHTYHHAKGIHKHNYSDLAFIDLIFGTFYNPESYEHETGFYEGGSSNVGDMLLFKDINENTEKRVVSNSPVDA